jgi:signal transduction histidine kinase
MFYNLIDDTLKHGENVSQIRVYHEEGENQLKLVYEDDGVGIPENEKELIFREGYGKGTGYGLYLIKKICETYDWTIKETGKQGKGAQFTIAIPKTIKNGKKSYRIN